MFCKVAVLIIVSHNFFTVSSKKIIPYCITSNNHHGVCVPLNTCQTDFTPFQLSPRANFDGPSKQWKCDQSNMKSLVCCKLQFRNYNETLIREFSGGVVKNTTIHITPNNFSIQILLHEVGPSVVKETKIKGLPEGYTIPTMPTEKTTKTSQTPFPTTTVREEEREEDDRIDNIELTTFVLQTDLTVREEQREEGDRIDNIELSTFVPQTDLPQVNETLEMELNALNIWLPPSQFLDMDSTEDLTEESLTPQTKISNSTIQKYYKKRLLPHERICGFQHTDDYRYNKTETALDEYPWLALLRYQYIRNGSNAGFRGGGTLISRKYVLTTAYVIIKNDFAEFDDLELTSVRLGEYNPFVGEDCFEDPELPECTEDVIDVTVDTVIVHPDYVAAYNLNDIALIRLSKIVIFTDYVRPICLPLPGTVLAAPGETVVTSGWGSPNSSLTNGKLFIRKKRSYPILVTNRYCEEHLRNVDENTDVIIINNFLCTRDFGKEGLCFGDAGIPVMAVNKKQWHIEAMLVNEINSCGMGAVSVHTRISSYLDWIFKNLKP